MSELIPEEKRRIYEEERTRMAAQEHFKKKIRRKTKPSTWGCLILIILIIIMAIGVFSPSKKSEVPSKTFLIQKKKQKEILFKIEQKVKAISVDEFFNKYISISRIEDNGSIYRITINLLFEPENYKQVQTWTDAVCRSSRQILKNYGITRDISVWANKPMGKGEVTIYGRTYYSHRMGKYEFKNVKELNL